MVLKSWQPLYCLTYSRGKTETIKRIDRGTSAGEHTTPDVWEGYVWAFEEQEATGSGPADH